QVRTWWAGVALDQAIEVAREAFPESRAVFAGADEFLRSATQILIQIFRQRVLVRIRLKFCSKARQINEILRLEPRTPGPAFLFDVGPKVTQDVIEWADCFGQDIGLVLVILENCAA